MQVSNPTLVTVVYYCTSRFDICIICMFMGFMPVMGHLYIWAFDRVLRAWMVICVAYGWWDKQKARQTSDQCIMLTARCSGLTDTLALMLKCLGILSNCVGSLMTVSDVNKLLFLWNLEVTRKCIAHLEWNISYLSTCHSQVVTLSSYL